MQKTLLFLATSLLCLPLMAQINSSDYEKADSIVKHYSSLIYHQVKSVHKVPKSSDFWYKTKTADGMRYWYVDSEGKNKKALFDNHTLTTKLSESIDKELTWQDLSLSSEKLNKGADTLRFHYKGYKYTYTIGAQELTQTGKIPDAPKRQHWARERDELGNKAVVSPDKSKTALIREYNLYIKDNTSKELTQITFDGSPGDYYSSYIKWSPNSKYVAVHKFKPAPKRYISFIESAPKDQWQPKVKEVEYRKPGDALPIKTVHLVSVEDKKIIPIDFNSYQQQYRVSDPVWRKDSRAFTVEYNQRGHQKYSVLEISTVDGNITILAEENPETFFTYSSKKYRQDIDDGKEMIWMSERDGWNHLYLYDNNGQVKNQITKGEYVVRNVIKVNKEERSIIFSAGGMNKGEDPYHLHYYSIDFDGKHLKALTKENANHQVTFSSDYKYIVDYYSRADFPGKTVLRDVDNGKILMELESTDITALQATEWKQAEVFTAKGRDNETDIWGLIYRPSHFDPNKQYPVIEYIYAGPHSSFVPKDFSGVSRRYSALAELGFICVQIDGMGTSNRSKAFHDVCWKNLKDAGFPDRIAWMKAAADTRPYMDIERVGIYGGSAGGQSSTGAVLFHPEFYDVAVSSCGCHDNRMDKIWWNEQWMGYPIEAHYDSCSNVVNAHKLEGNLMLILGEIDDNVDPASTTQVVDALVKADKEFEFVLLPGMNHTLGGSYGERKRRDFFIKHLLDGKTPDWNK